MPIIRGMSEGERALSKTLPPHGNLRHGKR